MCRWPTLNPSISRGQRKLNTMTDENVGRWRDLVAKYGEFGATLLSFNIGALPEPSREPKVDWHPARCARER